MNTGCAHPGVLHISPHIVFHPMRKLIKTIRHEVLPIVDGDLISLIEVTAGIMAPQKILPEYKGGSTSRKKRSAREAAANIHDWKNADASILGCIYESLMEVEQDKSRQGKRRVGGIFYTPSYITEFLVKASIDALPDKSKISPPQIIDPACGCGAFLLSAFRELRKRYPNASSQKIVNEFLHGVDSDPNAVHVARISLWLVADLEKNDWKALVRNIRHGDSLRDFLKGEGHKFQIVVGNPPYRNVKRGISKETGEFCKSHYRCAKGQWDLAAPFVELSLEHLLEPSGSCGFILPNPIFLAENYQPIREIILENDLVAFGGAGRPFSDPGVEASLLIARAGRSTRRMVTILDGKNKARVSRNRSIPKILIHRLPFRIFSHLAKPEFLVSILDNLENGKLVRLGEAAEFTRGIECGKRDPRILQTKDRVKNAVPLIVGKAVSAYSARPSHQFLLPKKIERGRILKDENLWKGERQLLLRRVAPHPIAAVATPASLVLNTLYVVRGEKINEYATCALFNSSIFREIFRQMFAFDDRLFPYIRKSQICEIPVPPDALDDARLAAWSEELHKIADRETGSLAGGKANKLTERINERVAAMYG